MKKYIGFLTALLLLSGCAVQPPAVETAVPSEGIKPTGYTLNRTDISFFNPGERFDLKVRLVPEDAGAEVTWTSSNPDVASVSWNGRVTAISGGMVTITAAIEGVGEQTCIVRCQFADPATPTLEPTPEPTSIGIEVDIGDGEHKFWVELAEEGDGKQVNIYEKQGDARPIQTFENKESFVGLSLAGLTAEDVNFDGYMDFHFYTSFGYSIVSHSSYYVWDPEEGCFVPDPYGLNELSALEFSSEQKEVTSLFRGPMGTTVTSYQYENGVLVEVGERFCPEPDSDWKAYEARYITVDDTHAFWVKVVDTDGRGSLEVNIYQEKEDAQPVQTLNCNSKVSLQASYLSYLYTLYTEDMDFDGDTDFGVLYSIAPNGHSSFSYYIWNEKEEKFILDPYGLNELCSVGSPDMLPAEKAIRTFMRSNAGRSGEVRFYRYLQEGFTCVRKMDWEWHEDTDYTDFLVENYENGEMRIVYQDSLTPEALDGYLWSDEFSNWWDLSYPSE